MMKKIYTPVYFSRFNDIKADRSWKTGDRRQKLEDGRQETGDRR